MLAQLIDIFAGNHSLSLRAQNGEWDEGLDAEVDLQVSTVWNLLVKILCLKLQTMPAIIIITDNAYFTTMSSFKTKLLAISLSVLLGLGTTPVQAHLMVAQHGTLNFLDDDVFMVLSLPASAFVDADENKDGLLSITEFSTHRSTLIKIVSEHVSLSTKEGDLLLNGLIISPVTPHNAPKEPADQIIAMGRFALDASDEALSFHVGLFGATVKDQTLEITATRKSENKKQVFELTPKTKTVKLTFK